MLIIGITGTIGAGKGTIVSYLLKKGGFSHLSVRDFLIEEIKKRNLPVNRDSMVIVANGLRKNFSPAYIVEQLYKKIQDQNKNYIIESIRNVGEIEALKSKGNFYLLAIDAEPKIRYERIVKRGGETDHISFEEFLENEKRESYSSDPNAQNISECIKRANFILYNDGTIEELHKKLDELLDKLQV